MSSTARLGRKMTRDDECEHSCRALPKNLITLLLYRTQRGAVSEAYCPDLQCMPQVGMRKTAATGGETKRRRRFQLPCDLSYTRSAWQKFRHRLVPATRGAARRDEASGRGGARVDIPLVLMLVQVGKEPPL